MSAAPRLRAPADHGAVLAVPSLDHTAALLATSRRRLDADPQFRPYFEQETGELPGFYVELARRDLGPLWEWLPEGALFHDPCAYLKSQNGHAHRHEDFVSELSLQRAAVAADADAESATGGG